VSRPYPRGAVVVGPRNRRPYLLISTDDHPFYGEEYSAVPVTSTPRRGGLELTDDRLREGELPVRSFAIPWNVVTLKHNLLSVHVGTATETATESLVERVIRYIRTR